MPLLKIFEKLLTSIFFLASCSLLSAHAEPRPITSPASSQSESPTNSDSKTIGANSKLISVDALLKLFMPQISSVRSTQSESFLPWDIGAGSNTAIDWKTSGIKDCESKENLGSFCRSGEVIISDSDKPAFHILKQKLEPGPWKILMSGPHAGVTKITVSSLANSQELERDFQQSGFLQSETHNVELWPDRECGEDPANGLSSYTAYAEARQPVYVTEERSCGSGGCGVTFTLLMVRQDYEKTMQATCPKPTAFHVGTCRGASCYINKIQNIKPIASLKSGTLKQFEMSGFDCVNKGDGNPCPNAKPTFTKFERDFAFCSTTSPALLTKKEGGDEKNEDRKYSAEYFDFTTSLGSAQTYNSWPYLAVCHGNPQADPKSLGYQTPIAEKRRVSFSSVDDIIAYLKASQNSGLSSDKKTYFGKWYQEGDPPQSCKNSIVDDHPAKPGEGYPIEFFKLKHGLRYSGLDGPESQCDILRTEPFSRPNFAQRDMRGLKLYLSCATEGTEYKTAEHIAWNDDALVRIIDFGKKKQQVIMYHRCSSPLATSEIAAKPTIAPLAKPIVVKNPSSPQESTAPTDSPSSSKQSSRSPRQEANTSAPSNSPPVAWLGVRLKSVRADEYLRHGNMASQLPLIVSVLPNSPAIATLQSGDVVLAVNDVLFRQGSPEFISVIKMHSPGDLINLTILRNHARSTISVQLGTRPAEETVNSKRDVKPQIEVAQQRPLNSEAASDHRQDKRQNVSSGKSDEGLYIIYQIYILLKSCEINSNGAINLNAVRNKMKAYDQMLRENGADPDALFEKAKEAPVGAEFGLLRSYVMMLPRLVGNERVQALRTCSDMKNRAMQMIDSMISVGRSNPEDMQKKLLEKDF